MAKKVEGYIKLQIPAGGATPAPPVGPALGQHGVNIMDFCKQFNAKTQDKPGMVIPASSISFLRRPGCVRDTTILGPRVICRTSRT